MTAKDLTPLIHVSRLLLERELAALRGATLARDESLRLLADLEQPATNSDLPLAAEAEVALRYRRWAEGRRREINLTLARQTADWLEARDRARLAFGRVEVLDKLADRS